MVPKQGCKHGIFSKNRPFPASFLFIFVFSTNSWHNYIQKLLPMSGFELQISGVGVDRFANCATTTAHHGFFLFSLTKGALYATRLLCPSPPPRWRYPLMRHPLETTGATCLGPLTTLRLWKDKAMACFCNCIYKMSKTWHLWRLVLFFKNSAVVENGLQSARIEL